MNKSINLYALMQKVLPPLKYLPFKSTLYQNREINKKIFRDLPICTISHVNCLPTLTEYNQISSICDWLIINDCPLIY